MNPEPIRANFAPPSLEIALAGEEVVLDWRAAAWFPRHGLLVVSDLHLEKGSSHARRGVLIPPYDTGETLARLAGAIAAHDPRIVVCLGDSFHDREGHDRLPAAMAAEIGRLAAGRDWCWISGNHDPEPPAGLAGFPTAELAIGRLLFRHEPRAGAAPGEVAGHLHPGATVRRRGRTVQRPCFASDGNRLIMPAFGAYTGMLNVRSPAFGDLFDGTSFHSYLLGQETIYPLAANLLAPGRRQPSFGAFPFQDERY